MNSDVATRCATRPEDHRRTAVSSWCWACTTMLPDEAFFLGRCWNCTHAWKRAAAVRGALLLLLGGDRPGALVVMVTAVNAQAAREHIDARVVVEA